MLSFAWDDSKIDIIIPSTCINIFKYYDHLDYMNSNFLVQDLLP